MMYYPAVIVSVDAEATTVRIEATGQQIKFAHSAHNSIAAESRQPGTVGFISFPKAPPVFTVEKVIEHAVAA